MIKRTLSLAIAIAAFNTPLTSYAEKTQMDFKNAGEYTVEPSIALKGGFVMDRALYASSGRETQIWKMTNLRIGADINKKNSNWGAKIELMPLQDEVRKEKNDRAYFDYYKNMGTDILYYGDHSLREAYLDYSTENFDFKLGRVINNYGFDYDGLPYVNRHEAPHSTYLNNEILTGAQFQYDYDNWQLDLGILNGRGKPHSSYNFYIDGKTDPNVKGNNTPVIETRIAYDNQIGAVDYNISASYHRNKTGSAPGRLYSGKHNDNRYSASFKTDITFNSWVDSLETWGQYNQYELGLTEEGVQKGATPEASKNIEKTGWFLTNRLNIDENWSIQHTYERIDRMSTLVWAEVAEFDESHPSFDSVETNNIMSVKYHTGNGIDFSLYYSKPDFDYLESSNIMPEKGIYKGGFIVDAHF